MASEFGDHLGGQMLIQDQRDAIAFLSDPASHGIDGRVERISTHISEVFLAGDRAFKLKKAVRLPYVDFSTPEIRLAACEKELKLNRATTPELYLGVRRMTREAGVLAFDGPGEMVDSVVEMRRFAQQDLLDRMALRGALRAPLITELAKEIASAHASTKVADDEGGAANIARVLDINHAGFEESGVFTADEIAAIDGAFRRAQEQHADRLDARARAGCIRLCHGDLHLRNVCLIDGRPRLFDCIDFNDRLATVDMLYDLAFMVMDLWHRGMPAHANLLTNHYMDLAGQEDGFSLMPVFTALRAAVRAHVTATQAAGGTGAEAERLKISARSYYDLALRLLEPTCPRLVAIGGLSGSGKSTIATALAPAIGAPPGARLIESDRVRKAMFDVQPETHLPGAAYAIAVSDKVYAKMAGRAAALLRSGCSVVVDAVYDCPARRTAIAEVARVAEVPFDGIWLQAPPAELLQRVAERRGGASDATPGIVKQQLDRNLGRLDWKPVSTSGSQKDTLATLRALPGLLACPVPTDATAGRGQDGSQ